MKVRMRKIWNWIDAGRIVEMPDSLCDALVSRGVAEYVVPPGVVTEPNREYRDTPKARRRRCRKVRR